MIYLFLCILFTGLIFISFKLFDKFGIENQQAIFVNYLTAASLGLCFSDTSDLQNVVEAKWFYPAIILGFIFIILFNLVAVTTQKIGVAIATLSAKMSVVIPVGFAFLFMNNEVTTTKIIGIALVLVGVYLTIKKDQNNLASAKYWYLPILLFVGNGILDTILTYTQSNYVEDGESSLFITSLFIIAGAIGALVFLFTRKKLRLKSIVAGVALGIPNYASIHCLLLAIDQPQLETSYIFPVLNIGTVILTTLAAFLIFKERLSKINTIGIFIALIAIVIMSWF